MRIRLNSLLCSYCILSGVKKFQPGNALKGISGTRREASTLSSDKILFRTTEKELRERGFEYVIGVDEAGRGPLAGPVVVASVIALSPSVIQRAADSKKLSAKVREEIYFDISGNQQGYLVDVEVVNHNIIDEINILEATLQGMRVSINRLISTHFLDELKCYALVDGNKTPPRAHVPVRAVVRGDALIYPIALASIVAKVTRDELMVRFDTEYPGYGFAKHKGALSPDMHMHMHIHSYLYFHYHVEQMNFTKILSLLLSLNLFIRVSNQGAHHGNTSPWTVSYPSHEL